MSDVPTHEVTLLPHDLRFEARADESLLKAGLRAMAPMRSSCRNGTCRTCLCRLDSGAIAYEIEWPGVTREEQAEGLVLPCVARPLSDVVLRYEAWIDQHVLDQAAHARSGDQIPRIETDLVTR